MKNTARIDFELHWALDESKFGSDPFHDNIRNTVKCPYRVWINDQLMSERDFNLKDRYYIREQHFLSLEGGQYVLAVEDLSGLLKIDIKNFRLNGTHLPSWVFIMP